MSRGPKYEPVCYKGEITSHILGTNAKGNSQFVLKFNVLGKIDPTNPEGDLLPCEEGERTIFQVINENTINMVMDILNALGFDKDSFKYLDQNAPGAADFRGDEHEFYCEHDTYNGKKQDKWGLCTGGKKKVEPLDSKGVRELDNMFGKQLKALPKKNGKKPTPKPQSEPQPASVGSQGEEIPDDEIPF